MSKKLIDFTPSNEVVNTVREKLGLDEKRVLEALDGIKSWLQFQPHLPKDEDDGRLERWLIRRKNNMEKTKESLDVYYSMKTICPEFMYDRDPNGSFVEEFATYGYAVTMPRMTSENDRVSYAGIWNSDTENYNLCYVFKVMLMLLEIRMCEDYFLREIYVLDCKHLTVNHVPKISPILIKKFLLGVMRGCGWRIKAIHVLNLPSFAEILVNTTKKLLKQKIIDRLHIHGTDLTEFKKQIPSHLLPADYGGQGESLRDLSDQLLEKMKRKREWYLKQEKVKSDESKRPFGKSTPSDIFGIEGSFRQLTID